MFLIAGFDFISHIHSQLFMDLHNISFRLFQIYGDSKSSSRNMQVCYYTKGKEVINKNTNGIERSSGYAIYGWFLLHLFEVMYLIFSRPMKEGLISHSSEWKINILFIPYSGKEKN